MATPVANVMPVEILLVDDSPGDVRLTQEALLDAKVHLNLCVASDGEEAMGVLPRMAKRPWLFFYDGEACQCASP